MVLMYLSFGHNIFNAVNPEKFYTTGSTSDALVIGRLIESREHGLVSSEGRMGRFIGTKGDLDKNRDSNQTKFYLGGIESDEYIYTQYDSQFGAQGMFFSGIDSVFAQLRIDTETRLIIFHSFLALLFSLTLTCLLIIIYDDIGLTASILILISILLSRWQVYYAKSLYWMLPTMFFPMLMVFLACKLESMGKKFNLPVVSLLVMLLVMIDALMGYEYITTVILSAVTPLVYFMIRDDWDKKQMLQRFMLIGFFAFLGFIAALLLHTYQLQLATGSYTEALDIIKERILVRTYTNPADYAGTPYFESQKTSVFYVLYEYLLKGGTFRLKIPFLLWILMLAYITNKYYRNEIISSEPRKKILKTLIVTTWFSLLASLSWIVLAKSHSEIHTQVNYIVFHLPFMLFAFALFGVYWEKKLILACRC